MSRKYYEDDRISQSQLKRFLNPNPRSLHRVIEDEYEFTKEKLHFSKGRLLDLMIEGKDVNDFFYILPEDYKHPSAVMESIIQACINAVDNEKDITLKLATKIKEDHGYQNRWTEKKIKDWYDNTLLPYISLRWEAKGLTLLTQKEFEDIAVMANAIMYGKYTKPILDEYPGEAQVEIYRGKYKALLDRLQIDHDKKVFRVIDYKTTGKPLEQFVKSIKRFRYDIQLSFYSYLVSLQYPAYKMLNPILIVVSTLEPEYAEPFELSEQVVQNARDGWVDKFGIKYTGWEELMDRANSYQGEMYNKELIEKHVNIVNEL